ncbi:MAG: carboxypeptidase regulatory-like domain-containing protein [Planctomycetes bacterium]|nr:carboxypeptidase regulatory-like domain-containing protein [Planctomycetota bacterium]
MLGRQLILLILLVCGMMCGCQDAGDDRPNVVPVRGTVTLRGTPVEGAEIKFEPKTGLTSAFGVTDAAGNYELTTFQGGDGAQPGEYIVTVFKYQEQPQSSASMDSPGYDATGKSAATAPAKNLLPQRFAEPSNSGLMAIVKADGENQFNFDLK